MPSNNVVVLERTTETIEGRTYGDVDHPSPSCFDKFEIVQAACPARVRHWNRAEFAEKLYEF
jgi:hypothetical protein